MRKLKLQAQMSVDGFISGHNNEMDWMELYWSDDIIRYIEEITKTVVDISLDINWALGFIPYWAGVSNNNSNPEQESGVFFTQTPNIVFSKTLASSK